MALFSKKKPGAKPKAPQTKSHTAKSHTDRTTIIHPSLGEIIVARNVRARRISISIRPPGSIRLTLPPLTSTADGLRFVESKQDWIKKAIERVETKSKPELILPPYSTRRHSLELVKANTARIRVRIAESKITVAIPDDADPCDEPVQFAIKKGIEKVWRIEAKELLPNRTAEIAGALGFSYSDVSIRNTVSKWGSCSARNDISLSLHLMRLPNDLIDYIIIHELCHTVHKNHGSQFHALLDKHTGGRHLALRRELKKYNTRW